MIKKIIAILIVGFSCIGVSAQVKQIYSFNWDMGSTIGADYRGFVDNFSPNGFSFKAEFFVVDNLSLSFNIGWHNYHKNIDRTTYDVGQGIAMTGKTYNRIDDMPLNLGIYYHVLPDHDYIRPYAGFGIGTILASHEIWFQDVAISSNEWGFALLPEVGVYVPFGAAPVALNIYARYGVSFTDYVYQNNELGPYQFFNIGIGLSILVN